MQMMTAHLTSAIESLIQADAAFALYRMPWTDGCRLVWQTSGEVEQLPTVASLGTRSGFVMAPFSPSVQHPVVLIRPDVTAYGWEEIAALLAEPSAVSPLSAGQGQPSVPAPSSAEESAAYQAAFHRFIQPLQAGRFRKLVLSRASLQPLVSGFSVFRAFQEACRRYPRMMVYLCHTPVTGTWMGSTPEILLSGELHSWHTVALAGTMPMQGDVMPTHWSEKNRQEQAYVADYIRTLLSSYGHEITEEGPYTTRAGGVVHLKTDFHFLLHEPSRLGELLDALHPTPAVCGLPKQDTYHFINRQEGYDRRYYSGFVGPLNPGGHTALFVNLRCMEIFSEAVRLYAGGGILSQSEATSEWQETVEKMKTMRALLG